MCALGCWEAMQGTLRRPRKQRHGQLTARPSSRSACVRSREARRAPWREGVRGSEKMAEGWAAPPPSVRKTAWRRGRGRVGVCTPARRAGERGCAGESAKCEGHGGDAPGQHHPVPAHQRAGDVSHELGEGSLDHRLLVREGSSLGLGRWGGRSERGGAGEPGCAAHPAPRRWRRPGPSSPAASRRRPRERGRRQPPWRWWRLRARQQAWRGWRSAEAGGWR